VYTTNCFSERKNERILTSIQIPTGLNLNGDRRHQV